MSSFLPFVVLVAAAILFKNNWFSYYRGLPAFVNEYKTSDTYWLSALFAAYYGSSQIQIIPEYRDVTLTAIVFLPLVGYYVYYRPFGLSCKYSPIDEDRNVIDVFYRNKKIAEKVDGMWEIKLEMAASKHITEYCFCFNPPEGSAIDFVDYQTNKIQDYDDENDFLKVESDQKDNFTVGVYVVEDSGLANDDRDFKITEKRTGKTLCEISLVG